MTTSSLPNRHVTVVGGGLVGRAIAWRAATAGATVTLVDDARSGAASSVAAGMLAPITEVVPGEEDLLTLTVEAARQWPTFATELEAASGHDVGYRPDGTLVVGRDLDDVTALDDLQDLQRQLGLDVERLRSSRCRELEPLLHPRIRGGLLVRDDHRVDPQAVHAALGHALQATGVVARDGRVTTVEHAGDRVHGVVLDDGATIGADQVVISAGAWSPAIADVLGLRTPVRPVKGQLLIARPRDGRPPLRRTVRGRVHGRGVYLVPRDDGRVVIGATQEEMGFDTTPTAGAIRTLLDDAAALVPGVDEWDVIDIAVGLRPSSVDNRPIIGPTGVDGLFVATGHHRHGVLLTPITADGMVSLLAGHAADPTLISADPQRAALRSEGWKEDR